MTQKLISGLEFSRSLYSETVEWYKNADTKAQILLTLIGVFIGFLTNTVFMKFEDLHIIIEHMTTPVWIFLGCMIVAMVLSLVCALSCLWSRIFFSKEMRNAFLNLMQDKKLPARLVGFFGTIWQLPKSRFIGELTELNDEDEVRIRLEQIYALSKNVYRKHLYIDIGFVLGGISLLFFLFAAVSYIANI